MNPPFLDGGLAGGLMAGLLLASAKAAVAVLLVLALRALAGRHLPPRWRAALWLPVAIRLLLPVGPRNPWSLFALAADGGTVAGSGELLPGLGGGGAPLAGGGAAGGGAWAGLVAQIQAHAPLLAVLLATVWALGVAVLALRRWLAVRRLDALMAARIPVSQRPALRVLNECRTAFGLDLPVELAESAHVAGPCLCPPRRGRPPAILLPRGAAATLGEDPLRHVLLHELAHLAHRDLAVRRLAGLLGTLHWFNPLVHLATRALRSDQELAADERALALLAPSERPRYGRTLIDLLPGTAAASPAAAFVETRNQLHRRILMIARFTPRHRLATAAAAALLLLLAGLVLTDGGAEAAPAAAASTAAAAAGNGNRGTAVAAQQQALQDMRAIGRAMWAWSQDHTDAAAAEHPAGEPWDWSRCPRISHAELTALLVPQYADALPAADPWGHDYELCLARTGAADGYRLGVRSAGSDGRFATAVYASGAFPPSQRQQDLVWIDGLFVRWPEK